jgi:hypothetical protein
MKSGNTDEKREAFRRLGHIHGVGCEQVLFMMTLRERDVSLEGRA